MQNALCESMGHLFKFVMSQERPNKHTQNSTESGRGVEGASGHENTEGTGRASAEARHRNTESPPSAWEAQGGGRKPPSTYVANESLWAPMRFCFRGPVPKI